MEAKTWFILWNTNGKEISFFVENDLHVGPILII